QSLMNIAKGENIATFIVGHVTKEGQIAGPRLLEHMVDTVLYFEGDQHHTFRILRAVKNRFGSTNEMGIFEMKNIGLKEVLNPSEIFLEERSKNTPGSAIVATMEGTRAMLVEVQALVTPTHFHNPRRMATGIDQNRLSLLMAVLEKSGGYLMQQHDAYIKVAGGVKLEEPAVDLSVIISIASSFKNKEVRGDDCFIGEVGLTGEVRRVTKIESRLQEAAKLGFKRAIVPKASLAGIQLPEGLKVLGVNDLGQAIQYALNSRDKIPYEEAKVMLRYSWYILYFLCGVSLGVWLFPDLISILPVNLPAILNNALIHALAGGLLFLTIFYWSIDKVEQLIRKGEGIILNRNLPEIIFATLGMVIGLVVAVLISLLLNTLNIPIVSEVISFALAIILGYLGFQIGMKKHNEVLELLPKQNVKEQNEGALGQKKLLDTSAIIDGRIIDVVKTGFIEGELAVPQFVLDELQLIADSTDSMKRDRGQRGLEMLHDLQESSDNVNVQPVSYDKLDVDHQLVQLAKEENA